MTYHDLLRKERPKPPGKETTCSHPSRSASDCSSSESSSGSRSESTAASSGTLGCGTDPIVATVKALLDERSARGIVKYGTTLARNDLSLYVWMHHARDEALDFALYLTRIMECLPKPVPTLSGSSDSTSTSCERTAERPSGDKEAAMSDSANVDPWVTFRPAGESTMTDAAKFLRPLCGVCSKAEDPSKLLGTCEECRAQATGGTSGYTAVEVDANAGKWTPASIPDLVARVQALEARVGDLEGGQMVTNWTSDLVKVAEILRPTNAETLEDAARRVVAERDERSAWAASVLINEEIGNILGSQPVESYVDAARRVVSERDAANVDRDKAVRLLHRFAFAMYGHQVGVSPLGAVRSSFEFLARHGLATDHGDGTFTPKEPKP